MTWTRLDDGWTDQPVFDQLPFDARWHYLAMVQFCSRTARYDGVLRRADAARCSDVPDPTGTVMLLADVGLVVPEEATVRLPFIAEHVPPPYLRDEARKQRQRMEKRRSRLHAHGDHSECLAERCSKAASQLVSVDVSTDTGTGQDGTGRELQEPMIGNEWDRSRNGVAARALSDRGYEV